LLPGHGFGAVALVAALSAALRALSLLAQAKRTPVVSRTGSAFGNAQPTHRWAVWYVGMRFLC
jgi:hypothetical protein